MSSPPPQESSPENAEATIFANQCLKCPTVRCAALCRRQTDKYGRGLVVVCDSCPKHSQSYLRCIQCQKIIHVGCDDGGGRPRLSWTAPWKCSLCEAVPGGGGGGAVTSGAATSGAAPSVPALQMQPLLEQEQSAAVAAAVTNSGAVSSTSSVQEMTYDSFESMYSALRNCGFRRQSKRYAVRAGAVTKELRTVQWACHHCDTNVTAHTTD